MAKKSPFTSCPFCGADRYKNGALPCTICDRTYAQAVVDNAVALARAYQQRLEKAKSDE